MLSGHRSQLRVVLDRSIVIHYDLDDSAAISADAISGADVYFKRSVTREQLRRAKVFALGLNVPVRHSPSGVACLERAAVNARLRWQSGRRSHLLANRADWQYVPSLRELERRPSRASRVMFLTRVWSPEDGKDADQAAHRHAMNETRAQLVRLLRENLGPDFVGGFEPDEYALDAYPDCVVSAVTFTDKRRYLASLADCAIGIASEGLHSSVGWKMAEYVAASRAVVSERIEAVIPGGFRKSLNYLEFSSPKECLDNVLQLQADINAQSRMMQANHDYWRMSLRPDVLVGRTLKLALAQCGAVCGPNLAAVSVTDESSW